MEIWKLSVVCGILAAFHAPSQSECPPDCTLLEWAEIYDLVTFITIVEKLTLFDEFTEGVNKTLFAPSDLAFNKVPKDVLESWKHNPSLLKNVLFYHVSHELWPSKRFTDGAIITSIDESGIIVNVYKSNLAGPINTVNGAGIQHQDIFATNGIMHIIDSVLYQFPSPSIFYFVANCGQCSTFLLALSYSDLSDDLTAGNWTLFVPNNEAFDKLPDGVLYNLLNNITLLDDTIKNHLVQGVYYEIALRELTYIENVDKRNLTISIKDTILMVNTAVVQEADKPTYTGVVHIIDTVLLLPIDTRGKK
ncbi:hypothetical protein CHS0354_018202 [Potamilus streckersoni]|uniref:FAS1 domain-containing protein n=1 Tax=Potamilus streckersoni TaxID=2493646 RepID=A0AAE0VJC7_9BIVA|nr:hypothetical protein CHS0354_018202 [Potamilus streckersoni]